MYKKHLGINGEVSETSIVRIEDDALIPFDLANTDYQAYLAWVAEGNTAEEWIPDAD